MVLAGQRYTNTANFAEKIDVVLNEICVDPGLEKLIRGQLADWGAAYKNMSDIKSAVRTRIQAITRKNSEMLFFTDLPDLLPTAHGNIVL